MAGLRSGTRTGLRRNTVHLGAPNYVRLPSPPGNRKQYMSLLNP